MTVFTEDEDGNEDNGNLSHLGATLAVNYEEIDLYGHTFRQHGSSKNAKAATSVTPEQFFRIKQQIKPYKHRDEGERSFGCPLKLSSGMQQFLNPNLSPRLTPQ